MVLYPQLLDSKAEVRQRLHVQEVSLFIHMSIIKIPSNSVFTCQVAMFERQQARMDGSPAMSLLNDLGQRCKTVKQLVSWLKKIGNDKALDILEYHGN